MKDKKIIGIIVILGGVVLCLLYYLVWRLEQIIQKTGYHSLWDMMKSPIISIKTLYLFGLLLVLLVLAFFYFYSNDFSNGQQVIAGKIKIPRALPSSEHGSARFATDKEQEKLFSQIEIDENESGIQGLIEYASYINSNLWDRSKMVADWEEMRERLEIQDWQSEEEKQKELRSLEERKEEILRVWEKQDNAKDIQQIEERIIKWREAKACEGGVIINYKKNGSVETIQVMNEDRHILMIGTTRSGKGRNVLLPSIGTIGISGENLLVVDPKGENYLYTKDYLERMGYQTIALDFRDPRKSLHYNYLQPVINMVNQDKIAEAINLCWDMTAQLVGEAKGEKIWNNGEASVIAGAIMAVVYDNRSLENKKYQNLTNVYYFIVNSSEEVEEGKTRLELYEESLAYDHPSKALFGIAKAAPKRTMGSFTTSALATLKLFTNPYIYEMTRESDFLLNDLVKKKTAIFLVLPDEKKTYHSVATLFVSMFYQFLVERANRYGGRLPIRYNFLLDEFGNFPQIPDMDAILTAAGSRGIRLCLVLQDLSQLEKNYGRENAKTIRNNCEIWIYLKTDDGETRKQISNDLGTYTIYNISKSKNWDKHSREGGGGISANRAGRELLKPEEIAAIDRPYLLLLTRGLPYISYSPDLSEWIWNSIYGLGDKKHNQAVSLIRNFKRKEAKGEIKIEVFHQIQGIKKQVSSFAMESRPVIKARTKPVE